MFMFKGDQAYIASVVATYWIVSISMVYLNKVLMSSDTVSIPAPLFITWFQCVITALICYAAGELAHSKLKREADDDDDDDEDEKEGRSLTDHGKPSFWAQFPKAQYLVGTGQKVFPLSLVFVGMITFNNLCLKWVEVSFYNVARSLTIVFNVILTQAMLGGSTSAQVMGCLGIVILGFFVGAQGEINFSVWGTLAGVLSSLFVSLNSIYTKKVLPVVDNDHWKLTFYNNVNACILFVPMILVFEHQPLAAAFGKQFLSPIFWSAMMVAGFFGFSIGIVTVLQIKATSPLSHNISGTAKAAVQSILAFYLWGNEWTFLGLLGIAMVLGGSLLYTIIKMNESVPKSTLSTTKEEDLELQKPLKS
ncbi:solute carrier family 35 (GDP-fucose transporter), member C1 [Fistulifera solaris]|uniref:Solute carrier family 35 (GDP-fucose transporter), member C1 n=1 Tax=Fistulifera solaris TaxID=1519565 RepID=A0A1Z5K679_FISSO|nr:solute carrier family 35 (GDP-fucose transporter), member C1 [Fistulifera solaris]|eukprot:GAX21760.1 solute carrier family 35 (GDP-fucose transporter), member C1 [Fistulifera solaris]